jgi:2-polyprenyl-6-methoxyphenol hydroxylase-like FAD-dependent oxidoreductase
VPRLPGERPDDIRLIARDDAGWFWLIPISDELMSVGVVLPKPLYMRRPHGDPEALLAAAIADTPVVRDLMAQAKREWPVRVEKEFSYTTSRYAGDRWILAGDAVVSRSGLFHRRRSPWSGIEAAAELDRALADDDFSTRGFAAFSRRQTKRFEVFRRFVIGFYTPQFRDLFFSPDAPAILFRAIVTVLAGNWNPSLWTRMMNHIFFACVAVQKRLPSPALPPRR